MNTMQLQVKRPGRKPTNTAAFGKIASAGKKQITILKKEWKLKVPPGAHILRKYLKAEYKVNSLENGKGWIIKKT